MKMYLLLTMPFQLRNTCTPRIRPITDYKQARHLQLASHSLCLKLKESIDSSTSAKERVFLARALRDAVSAWDTARDAVRIIRGRGLPTRVPEKLKPRSFKGYHILDIGDLPASEPKRLAPPRQKTEQPQPESNQDKMFEQSKPETEQAEAGQ